MALMVEAAELLELFQWQTLGESRSFTRQAQNQERVGEELADVLLYLLQLADHTGVDLAQATERKFAKNAEKYLAKKVAAAAADPEKPAPPTAAQIMQRVLASLKKMPANKPTRRAGMLKHIAAQAGGVALPPALAQQVLDLLVQKKQVMLSADGLRLSYPVSAGKSLQSTNKKAASAHQ